MKIQPIELIIRVFKLTRGLPSWCGQQKGKKTFFARRSRSVPPDVASCTLPCTMLASNSLLRTSKRVLPRTKVASRASKPRSYATLDQWKPHCPTWIDKNTKVICQGITGKQVRNKHCRRLESGTKLQSIFEEPIMRLLHSRLQHSPHLPTLSMPQILTYLHCASNSSVEPGYGRIKFETLLPPILAFREPSTPSKLWSMVPRWSEESLPLRLALSAWVFPCSPPSRRYVKKWLEKSSQDGPICTKTSIFEPQSNANPQM